MSIVSETFTQALVGTSSGLTKSCCSLHFVLHAANSLAVFIFIQCEQFKVLNLAFRGSLPS